MSIRRSVGKVSPEERDEIRALFERKNGLTELFKILEEAESERGSALYEKLVKDMGATSARFQEWWNKMSTQHKWENLSDHKWEIDFDSCEVFLKKE